MDERLRQAYDLFIDEGFISSDNVSFDTFSNANEEQIKQLYQGALEDKIISRKNNL